MPVGPNGERRPANPIESGIMAARIATGDIPEDYVERTRKPVPARAAGGKKGGPARAEALTPERRTEIAKAGATARWQK